MFDEHLLTFSYDSVAYLLNHSKTYTLAFLISFAEFWIGSLIYNKWNWRFILLGLIFVIGGQV
jgi:hypothetical protein